MFAIVQDKHYRFREKYIAYNNNYLIYLMSLDIKEHVDYKNYFIELNR